MRNVLFLDSMGSAQMLDTSARLLRLLSLLQSRPDWTGPELAERLGVTTRTIRNDIGRLRELDYPVDARAGVAGGYRLGRGASLPPLLLDDEEAVAVAVGLRTAAGSAVSGIEDASVRALMKLQQVLPSRLRHRTRAFEAAVQAPVPGPLVDAEVLTLLASACRDREVVRFDYRAHDGRSARRRTEPYRLVSHHRRWYLVAWDLDRDDWRTFRLDRVTPRTPTGPRFAPRPIPPDPEVIEQVRRVTGEACGSFGPGSSCTHLHRTCVPGCRSRWMSRNSGKTGACSSPVPTTRTHSHSGWASSTPTSRSSPRN